MVPIYILYGTYIYIYIEYIVVYPLGVDGVVLYNISNCKGRPENRICDENQTGECLKPQLSNKNDYTISTI